jgi:hypothetical protein
MLQQHIGRTIYGIHSAIDDLTILVASIGEHDARDLDEARCRLEQLSQKLRFTTLQAAE